MPLKLADAVVVIRVNAASLKPELAKARSILSKSLVITPRLNLAPLAKDIAKAQGMLSSLRTGLGAGGSRVRPTKAPGSFFGIAGEGMEKGKVRITPLGDDPLVSMAGAAEKRAKRATAATEKATSAVKTQRRAVERLSAISMDDTGRRTPFGRKAGTGSRGFSGTGAMLLEGNLLGFGRMALGSSIGIYGAMAGMAAIASPFMAISEYSKFERAFAQVEAIQRFGHGASPASVLGLQKQARGIGRQSIFSTTDVAQVMQLLSQRGFNTAGVRALAPNVIDLATATDSDALTTAETVMRTMKQFHLPLSEGERVADRLTAATIHTSANMSELGYALSMLSNIPETAGYDLEQTLAVLGTLSDVGLQSTKAGRGFRAMLSQLGSEEKREMARHMGIEVEDDKGNLLPMDVIAERMRKRLLEMGTAERMGAMFGLGGRVGGAAFSGLMAGDTAHLEKLIRDSDGLARKMTELMEGKMFAAFMRLADSMKDLAIGAIEPHADGIISFLDRLSDSVIMLGDATKNAVPEEVSPSLLGPLPTILDLIPKYNQEATAHLTWDKLIGSFLNPRSISPADTKKSFVGPVMPADVAAARAAKAAGVPLDFVGPVMPPDIAKERAKRAAINGPADIAADTKTRQHRFFGIREYARHIQENLRPDKDQTQEAIKQNTDKAAKAAEKMVQLLPNLQAGAVLPGKKP